MDAFAEHAFLIGRCTDAETIRTAGIRAAQIDVPLRTVLLKRGWVTREAYAQALADHLGSAPPRHDAPPDAVVIDAAALGPGEIAALCARTKREGRRPVVVGSRDPEPARVLDEATDGLRRRRPSMSAAGGVWLWQYLAAIVLGGLVLGGLLVASADTLALVTGIAALPFAAVTLIRLLALVTVAVNGHDGKARRKALTDRALPSYALLVPLRGEAAVAADLVAALCALDYPVEKLDVLIAVEADDAATLAALAALALPPHVRVLPVPAGEPRTKPKALNFALAHTDADYVAVYDAEDVPEPGQLRLAAERFAAAGGTIACLQARLNVHNARAGWLTRQFTLEYTVLFDAFLPALVRLGLPLPLGGTSNHFPRRRLLAAGGWDPYNVTEDADLGLRLTRQGGRIEMLASTTWEEAPDRLQGWVRQRTRWLKGWMQTYLVHMRSPGRLLADLGPWRFLGFQVLFGGVVLSALMQPLFYILILAQLTSGRPFATAETPLGQAFWSLAVFNLVAGYLAAMSLAAVAVLRRRRLVPLRDALSIPLYWLLIGLVAYRALLQLVTAPHRWEKTEHAARSLRAPAAGRGPATRPSGARSARGRGA